MSLVVQTVDLGSGSTTFLVLHNIENCNCYVHTYLQALLSNLWWSLEPEVMQCRGFRFHASSSTCRMNWKLSELPLTPECGVVTVILTTSPSLSTVGGNGLAGLPTAVNVSDT